MPYRDGAIDCIVTDLPFGKRIHDGMTGMNNRDLYTAVLKEFGRVCNSRCVVQTQDSRSLAFALTQPGFQKLIFTDHGVTIQD